MLGEAVLRERHVRVASAEPIAHAVAYEGHGPVGVARTFDGLLLARAAPDADRMGRPERERAAIPGVRDHGKVAESGRGEQRPDMEPEAVRDDREREALGHCPRRERGERGIEGAMREREGDQVLIFPAERCRLREQDVAGADLACLEGAVDLGQGTPSGVGTEPLEQVDADVVEAHGPVEVHDHRVDRQNPGQGPGRVSAWEHARMDLADRIVAAGLEGERVRAEVVEGGETLEVDGLLVSLSNLPASELNGTRVIREPDDPPTALEAARAVFRGRGHPFFGIEIEVGRHPRVEKAVRAAGLRRVDGWQTMAAPVDRLPPESIPSSVEIREVRHERDLGAVRSVEIATFGTPPDIAERFVGVRMLEDRRVRLYTAWVDGEPVGEASAYLLHDTVGIFGVGVVEAARRRGIGGALTIRAGGAFDDLTDIAWLQPSPMARGMYEALGFRPVSDWEVWIAR
jgi:ribosomal protein S18 acetylase RimI-like enzyme